jgi:hypothetical protein
MKRILIGQTSLKKITKIEDKEAKMFFAEISKWASCLL